MEDHWENCKGRKQEAKTNASEQSGQLNEQDPSEPKRKQCVISVLTTAPPVQKEAELQLTRARVAINTPFRAKKTSNNTKTRRERLKSAPYLKLKTRKTFFLKKIEIFEKNYFQKKSHSSEKFKRGTFWIWIY